MLKMKNQLASRLTKGVGRGSIKDNLWISSMSNWLNDGIEMENSGKIVLGKREVSLIHIKLEVPLGGDSQMVMSSNCKKCGTSDKDVDLSMRNREQGGEGCSGRDWIKHQCPVEQRQPEVLSILIRLSIYVLTGLGLPSLMYHVYSAQSAVSLGDYLCPSSHVLSVQMLTWPNPAYLVSLMGSKSPSV